MAEKGLPATTPKPVRAKIPAQTKARATPKPTTSKTSIPLEPKVVIQPIDHQEDQDTLYPPNQPNQLPDIPAAPQAHIPTCQTLQIFQILQILSTHQILQILQTHQILLQWKKILPNHINETGLILSQSFQVRQEEDAVAHLLKTNDWMDTHNFPEDGCFSFCFVYVSG